MFTVTQIKSIEDILEVSEDIVIIKNKDDGNGKVIRPQLYGVYKLPEVSLLSMGNSHCTTDFLNGLYELNSKQ